MNLLNLGMVSAASATGSTTPSVMRLGINGNDWQYWSYELPGRDVMDATKRDIRIALIAGSAAVKVLDVGTTLDDFHHWAETYSPTQNYPLNSTNPNDYEQCVYNGYQYRRTDLTTPRSGVAPDLSDPNGTTSGWALTGYADPSLVGMQANGWPSKLPDNTAYTLQFFIPWNDIPTAAYPVTINYATEPGVKVNVFGANVTLASQDIPGGTFSVTLSGDGSGSFTIDRTTPITSAFFLSGIIATANGVAYETGTPSADIGAPYCGKQELVDLAPFCGIRNMGASYAETVSGAQKFDFTAANVPTGGRRQWKIECERATTLSHPFIWVNIPLWANDAYVTAMASFYLAHLPSTTIVMLEWTNEVWNSNAPGQSVAALAAALAPSDAAYNNRSKLYARYTSHMVSLWRTAWGAASNRVQGVLAWQTGSAAATWSTMLDFENCYLNIGYVATAPYFDRLSSASTTRIGPYSSTPANLIAAVVASDFATFTSLLDGYIPTCIDYEINGSNQLQALYNWIPTYCTGNGLTSTAIKLASYEGLTQSFLVDKANWDAGSGAGVGDRAGLYFGNYFRSANYGARCAEFIDNVAAHCPHIAMLFQYVGPYKLGSGTYQGWGAMDRPGDTTFQPYATWKTKALAYNA